MTARHPETTGPPRFIEGKRLYLREVRPSDVTPVYYAWMNDPQVTQYLESRFFPYSQEKLAAYVADTNRDSSSVFFAIVLMAGDQHIGNIKLGPISWIHGIADIGLMIGEKTQWGHGYATEAIGLVKDYAFERLNLRKVTAGAYSVNEGSVRAFEKAGFVVEGVLKAHYFFGGDYVDRVCLAAWKQRPANV